MRTNEEAFPGEALRVLWVEDRDPRPGLKIPEWVDLTWCAGADQVRCLPPEADFHAEIYGRIVSEEVPGSLLRERALVPGGRWTVRVRILAEDTLWERLVACREGAHLCLDRGPSRMVLEQVLSCVRRKRRRPARICVVEDDPMAREWTARVLEKAGYEVKPCPGSEGLLEHLEAASPDLLLLEMEHEAFSGPDLCRALRGHPRWFDLPIVFLSACSGSDARQYAYRSGADDFLIRPVAPEELELRVARRLSRYPPRRPPTATGWPTPGEETG